MGGHGHSGRRSRRCLIVISVSTRELGWRNLGTRGPRVNAHVPRCDGGGAMSGSSWSAAVDPGEQFVRRLECWLDRASLDPGGRAARAGPPASCGRVTRAGCHSCGVLVRGCLAHRPPMGGTPLPMDSTSITAWWHWAMVGRCDSRRSRNRMRAKRPHQGKDPDSFIGMLHTGVLRSVSAVV